MCGYPLLVSLHFLGLSDFRQSTVCAVVCCPSVYCSLCGCLLSISLHFLGLYDFRQSTVCAVAPCSSVYSLCGCTISVCLQFVRLPVVRHSIVFVNVRCPSVYSLYGYPLITRHSTVFGVRRSTVCVGCRLSISLQLVRLSVALLSTVCAIGVVREYTICVGSRYPSVYNLCGCLLLVYL